jgi:hypothetical protein
MSNHSTTAPNRRALPWQFNVQVKGRASGSASRSKPHVVVKGQSVTDWLADQIPVLIVLCQVTGYRVEAAHCAWIDAFVYDELCWPLKVSTDQCPKAVRVTLTQEFTKRSRKSLLGYLEQWSPARRTAKNIGEFLAERSRKISAPSTKRRGVFKWKLFALPISYECRTPVSNQEVGTVKDLLCSASHRLVILGKPATGKTITVHRLIAQPPGDFIPILINAFLPAEPEELIHHICRTVGIASRDHFDWLERIGQVAVDCGRTKRIQPRRGNLWVTASVSERSW